MSQLPPTEVQYLAQGNFNMQLGGAGIQTSDLLTTRRPALPSELQPPQYCRGSNDAVYWAYGAQAKKI